MRLQDRGELDARPAAHVDDRRDYAPPPADRDVRVRRPVPRRAHQRVERSADPRMCGEVFPERLPEGLVVGGPAGLHVGRERRPGAGEPAADPVEVEHQPHARLEQRAARVVQPEASRAVILEDAGRREVRQHVVQRTRIAARFGGELRDARRSRLDPLRDAQRHDHAQAPRRAQICERFEVCHGRDDRRLPRLGAVDDAGPNALAHRFYRAFLAADRDALAAVVSEDAAWIVRLDTAVSGAHRGPDGIAALRRALDALSGGTWRPLRADSHDIAASEEHAVIMDRFFAEHADRRLDSHEAIIVAVEDGRIVRLFHYMHDPAAFATFWSR